MEVASNSSALSKSDPWSYAAASVRRIFRTNGRPCPPQPHFSDHRSGNGFRPDFLAVLAVANGGAIFL
jgi:hypothetical protein